MRINGLVTLKYLTMNFPLVVIPDLAAGLRKRRLNRQQKPHLLRLENPTLGIGQRDALSSKEKSGL
jgi:hypothetical protein